MGTIITSMPLLRLGLNDKDYFEVPRKKASGKIEWMILNSIIV